MDIKVQISGFEAWPVFSQTGENDLRLLVQPDPRNDIPIPLSAT
jgi:hypothetical protein